MTTTREDRERAAEYLHGRDRAAWPGVVAQWIETAVGGDNEMHAWRTRCAAAFAAHRLAERERVGKRLVELADHANNRAKAARRRVDDGDEERNTAVERALRDAAGELADTAFAAEIRSGR